MKSSSMDDLADLLDQGDDLDCSPPPTPQLGPVGSGSGGGGSKLAYNHNSFITSGVGTMMYASPEQIEGGDYDAKTVCIPSLSLSLS
jgi:serine/threonine protein kinase